MAEYKRINEPNNNDEEKVIDNDKNESTNKENQEVKKNKEEFKKVGKGCLGCLTFLLLIGGCTLFLSNDTEEVKLSCIRTVEMDTRETFDGVKFIVNINASDKGKGLIENLMTGEKQYAVFDDTYRNGKRNQYVPFPESIEDVDFARLIDGRVLFFNAGCETN